MQQRVGRTLTAVLVVVAAAVSVVDLWAPHAAGAAAYSVVPAPPSAAPEAELDRRGDSGWVVRRAARPDELAGYMSPSSTRPGGVLHLHLRSRVPVVQLAAYRNGHYGGAGGRRLWQRTIRALPPGPPVLINAATRTWSTNWPESTDVPTRGWPPGHYVIIATAGGKQTWVPFTITSPSFAGRVVLITENTTWQAYNAYGGTSLYHGRDGTRRNRAYAVSHDRPLDYGAGAGDYWGNELPLIRLAERLRLPLGFATNTDLEAAPGLLDRARAVVSLGHDEYWSSRMREQLRRARDRTGTNLAFFGANAIFRHIRLAPLRGVPNRLQINYKSASLDPITRINPAEATADWPSGPVPRDGKELTGGAYQCNPVKGDVVMTNTRTWLTQGLGLRDGSRLVGILGSEYDKIVPGGLAPRAIMSIARSPVTCRGRRDHADIAYYTVPSGAAGIDVGTSTWVCVLDDVCGGMRIDRRTRAAVLGITTRVLTTFARGPAGRAHPVPAR